MTAPDRTPSLRSLLLGTIALAGLVLPGAVRAEDGPDPALLKRHSQALVQLVQLQAVPQPTRADTVRLPLVQGLVQERQKGRRDLAGRSIQPLDRRDAVRRALDLNLSLSIARADPGRREQLIREAKAVFDPVFEVSISYTRADTQDRTMAGVVRPKTLTPVIGTGAGGEQVSLVSGAVVDPNNPFANSGDPLGGANRRLNFCSLPLVNTAALCNGSGDVAKVVALEFFWNTNTTPITEYITANPGRKEGHPSQPISYTLGLTQQLPWGGQLTLTDRTVQQKVYYRGNHYWEDGQFTTNLSGTLNMPLPFTKGFGKDNPTNAAIRAAQISRERADWELKSVVNQTLQSVDVAYFEVVRQLESLQKAVDNRTLFQRLQQRQARMMKTDPGLVTRYQEAQVNAEVSRGNVRIEQALQNYVSASITLAGLIGDPDARSGSVLYLPFGYEADPAAPLPASIDAAMATAKDNRPDFFTAKLDRQTADVGLGLAENQARPDLNMTATVNSNQNGSTYGYADPIQSHGRIARPDSLSQSYTLNYTYPLFNRAANAAVDRARLSVEDRDLAERSTITSARREITDRLASLQSARARQKLAGDEERSQRQAYESLERQLEAGLAGEDQVILAARRLLSAELSKISALVDSRQAEARLLTSEGIIANSLPQQTAQTTLERHRLIKLADAGHLAYFGPAVQAQSGQAQSGK